MIFVKWIKFIMVTLIFSVSFCLLVNANSGLESSIGIHAEIKQGGYVNSEIELFIYDEAEENLLSSKKVKITKGLPSFYIEFDVPEYKVGEKFVLILDSDVSEISFDGNNGKKFLLETYRYKNEEGEDLHQTIFYVNLSIEGTDNALKLMVDSEEVVYPYCILGEEVYISENILSDMRIGYEDKEEYISLNSESENLVMNFFVDNIYAQKNWVGYNLKKPVFSKDKNVFLPLYDIAEYFGCDIEKEENENGVTLNISSSKYKNNPLKDYVNSFDIESRTDYLIWISKKDYRVNLYLGENRKWRNIASYACALGAPETPTIEGEFEYCEYIQKWNYPYYYCGPVMRFYNGYALHSTLIKHNGELYDNRVEVNISHGCIRLVPEDIQYLVDYVPMGTKIIITP